MVVQTTGNNPQLPTRRPHHKGMDKGMVNPGMTSNIHMEDKVPRLQPTLKIQDTGSSTTCHRNRGPTVNNTDRPTHNRTRCRPNNLTLNMVLLLLLMMGIVKLLLHLLVMVSQFLGMVNRQHLLVMLRWGRLLVTVSIHPHNNLDTVNKQLQTVRVMVTNKGRRIQVMVAVKGWGMVHRLLFSRLVILNQHQLWLRFRFNQGMISRFLKLVGMQLHSPSHRLSLSLSRSLSHKQVVMVSMILVRCTVSLVC